MKSIAIKKDQIEFVIDIEYYPETPPSYSSGGEPGYHDVDIKASINGENIDIDIFKEKYLANIIEEAVEQY